MHGIHAVSPVNSISNDQLFYRPPESETSDPVHDEMESFDPVSYSYDPISEGVFDTSEFHTSTPPRQLSHFSNSSDDIFASSPEQLLPRSPLIAIDGSAATGDEKQKVRDWVFPLHGHQSRPSIARRHTFDSPHEDVEGDGQLKGVASTFASRVGDLRAFLAQNVKGDHLRVSSAQEQLTSSRSSVEFPIRSPTLRLAVVNSTIPGDATPLPYDAGNVEEATTIGQLKEELQSMQDRMDRLFDREASGHRESQYDQQRQVLSLLDKLNGKRRPPLWKTSEFAEYL